MQSGKKCTNIFDQSAISNQMRIFLQKDEKYKQAVFYTAQTIYQKAIIDEKNLEKCIELADKISTDKDYALLLEISKNYKVYGKTPNGNPIKDQAYPIFTRNYEESRSIEYIFSRLENGMKKAGYADKTELLAIDLKQYIAVNKDYKPKKLKNIIKKYVDIDI